MSPWVAGRKRSDRDIHRRTPCPTGGTEVQFLDCSTTDLCASRRGFPHSKIVRLQLGLTAFLGSLLYLEAFSSPPPIRAFKLHLQHGISLQNSDGLIYPQGSVWPKNDSLPKPVLCVRSTKVALDPACHVDKLMSRVVPCPIPSTAGLGL